jgi:general stress protein 26
VDLEKELTKPLTKERVRKLRPVLGGRMSKKSLDNYLKKSKLVAEIASVNLDGSPWIAPIWYEYDGKHIWLISKPKARYVENIQRGSKVALCIHTPSPPYKRVTIVGDAELVDMDWHKMGTRMVMRYFGRRGLPYLKATWNWERAIIKLTPAIIQSWDGGGYNWHPRYINVIR